MVCASDIINKAKELLAKVDAHISQERERAACIRHSQAGDTLSPKCRALVAPRAESTILGANHPKFKDYKQIYDTHKGAEIKDAFGNTGYLINGSINDASAFRDLVYNKLITKWNGRWFFTQNAIRSFEGHTTPVAQPPQQPRPQPQPQPQPQPEPPKAAPPVQPAPVPQPTPQVPVQSPATEEPEDEERPAPSEESVNFNSQDINKIVNLSQAWLRSRFSYSGIVKFFNAVIDAEAWDIEYYDDGTVRIVREEEEEKNKYFDKMLNLGLIDANGYITKSASALIPEYKKNAEIRERKKAVIVKTIPSKITTPKKYSKQQLLAEKGYSEIRDSSTTYEAQRVIKSAIPHMDVEYQPFELKVANACNKALLETNALFPEVIKRLAVLGNSYHVNAKLHTRTKSAAIARSFQPSAFNVGAISWNSRYCNNAKRIEDAFKRCVSSGFHPEGTASIDGVMHHELGHQMDYALNIRSDPEFLGLINKFHRDEIVFGVSGYAAKKNSELIAEAWGEYMSSPTPRPIAQAIGDLIVDRYNAKYKKV